MGNSQPVERRNNQLVVVDPAQGETAELLELNGAVESFERRIDGTSKEVKSFQERISVINVEELELHRRADEATSTYEYNVLAIMLLHGLGSVIVQVNYPHLGDLLPVLMVVSFFFAFVVGFVGNSEKNERLSQLGNDLRGRRRELLNEITYFGATVERPYSNRELKIFACNEAFGEVSHRVGLVNRQVASLKSTLTSHLELSSSSESNRMKSRYQVTVVAVIYGLGFPIMAYYFLYFDGFRRMGYSAKPSGGSSASLWTGS